MGCKEAGRPVQQDNPLRSGCGRQQCLVRSRLNIALFALETLGQSLPPAYGVLLLRLCASPAPHSAATHRLCSLWLSRRCVRRTRSDVCQQVTRAGRFGRRYQDRQLAASLFPPSQAPPGQAPYHPRHTILIELGPPSSPRALSRHCHWSLASHPVR